jgi:hypothetical protein
MRTDLGFELIGKFTMPNDEPPGLEGGNVIAVYFAGQETPLMVTVTKVVALDNGRRQITFATPLIMRIDPPALP